MKHIDNNLNSDVLCESCTKKELLLVEKRSNLSGGMQNDMKVLILDCRISGLQQESKLPICLPLNVNSSTKPL